jgi:hypothetical protein
VRRRTLILGTVASSWIIVTRAKAWSLITKEEYEREKAAPHPDVQAPAVAQAGAPTIDVDQPDASRPVRPPVTIRISFHPAQGSTIDVKSFRATYGFLGIDITQRILDNAQLTASGLFANDAQLPPGQYKVTLQIADNLHRVGTRTIEFSVV